MGSCGPLFFCNLETAPKFIVDIESWFFLAPEIPKML